jgi:Asp-tRNA(Asn)/Glu-tRNA(Gln) amidotransferase C subunit
MRQAKSCDWKPVLEEAKNLENLADRALVSETVALSLPANMSAERDHLLALARADVRKIPSELDQLERFIGFAEDLQKIDTKVCRELIAEAQTVLGRTAEGVERHKKRLIDMGVAILERRLTGAKSDS